MLIVTETENGRRFEVARLNSVIELESHVGALVFIEEDPDYPGCFDALTETGRVIAIEPEGFKLA